MEIVTPREVPVTAAPSNSDPASKTFLSFRDLRWPTWTLWVALAVLAMFRCMVFLKPWLVQLPWWLVLSVGAIVPQLFLIVFPLLTRQPRQARLLRAPHWPTVLLEFAIAIPIVILTIFGLGAANYLLNLLAPGKTITPDAMKSLAESSQPLITGILLVYAFTIAPVAEEIFFRGYLQNALSVRLPVWLAFAIQCATFGIVHAYGAIPTVAVVGLGVVLTATYLWRRTLITPMFVHSGINLFASLGMAAMMIMSAQAPVLGITSDPGDTRCVIRSIIPGSPAQQDGLHVGDIITAVDSEPVDQFPQLLKIIRRHQAGDTITVTVQREGKSLDIKVRLVSRQSLSPR